MDQKAVEKARDRLRIARRALADMRVARAHPDFADSWYMFLVSAKSVWTILEQGSKVSPQSRQWYGAKKQERRDTPELRYVFEARNDAEHGLEEGLELDPGGTRGFASFGASEEDRRFHAVRFNFLESKIHLVGRDEQGIEIDVGEAPMTNQRLPPHSKLKAVVDRGKNTIDPPWKAGTYDSYFPADLANYTIDYLNALISEAKALRTPSP